MRATTYQWLVLKGLTTIIKILLKRGSPDFHNQVADAIDREAAKLQDLEASEEAASKQLNRLALEEVMKAYGVRRGDCACCYGHYKYGAKLKDRDHALSINAKNGDRARQAGKKEINADA